MRLLLISLLMINCLIFIQAEQAVTTLLPQYSAESIDSDIAPEIVQIRNHIGDIKPVSAEAESDLSRQNEKPTSTTSRPKISVYALINAKKDNKKTKAGKCKCFGETSWVLRYTKVLEDDLELGDQGNLDCARPNEATQNCEKLCRQKAIERFGEVIDLKKPYSMKDDKVSIGQEVCRQVGSLVVHLTSHLKVKSHIVCPGQNLALYKDTGLKSKQRFACVFDKFVSFAP